MTQKPFTIGVFVFDEAREWDVVGPLELLTVWARQCDLRPQVRTFSADGAGVRLAHGLCLVPDDSASDIGPLHVLVHPGGPGTRALTTDHHHLGWLRGQRATTPLLAALGTGTQAFAAAGLLAGRPVAAPSTRADELAVLDPSIIVDTEALVLDDGDVVTARSTSAGLELAVRLVERLDGPEAAAAARGLALD